MKISFIFLIIPFFMMAIASCDNGCITSGENKLLRRRVNRTEYNTRKGNKSGRLTAVVEARQLTNLGETTKTRKEAQPWKKKSRNLVFKSIIAIINNKKTNTVHAIVKYFGNDVKCTCQYNN